MLTTTVYLDGRSKDLKCKMMFTNIDYSQLRGDGNLLIERDEEYIKLNEAIKCESVYNLMNKLLKNDTGHGRYFVIVDPDEVSQKVSSLMEGLRDKITAPVGDMPAGFSHWVGHLAIQNFASEVISPTISPFYESSISNLWKQRERIFSVLATLRKDANFRGQFEAESLNVLIRRKIGDLPHIFDNEALPLSLELIEQYFLWYSVLLGICLLVFSMELLWGYLK